MLVDRLEGSGWVHREPHPTDRRAVLLELADAPAGVPAGLAAYHARIEALSGGVPGEHREALSAFLQKAAEAAAEAAEELGRQTARR